MQGTERTGEHAGATESSLMETAANLTVENGEPGAGRSRPMVLIT